jgi:hypothetical protein
MQIVNQTGRLIRIRNTDGRIIVWTPNPKVPTAKAVPRYLGGEVVDGISFVIDALSSVYIEHLMPMTKDTLLIVEDEVRRECLDRPDLISPMPVVKDERGVPVYSHGFICNRQVALGPSKVQPNLRPSRK